MKAITPKSTKFCKRLFNNKKRTDFIFNLEYYYVYFTPTSLRVAGKTYSHEEWTSFGFLDLHKMSGLEWAFWTKWGNYFRDLLILTEYMQKSRVNQ